MSNIHEHQIQNTNDRSQDTSINHYCSTIPGWLHSKLCGASLDTLMFP